MKAFLRKKNYLAIIREKPTEITDDAKWNEMDDNAIADLHLAVLIKCYLVWRRKSSRENMEYSHEIVRVQFATQ